MKQEIEEVDVSIKWPFKWTLVGSSGSGKTNFALNIVKRSNTLFDQKPEKVVIIYKVFQKIYDEFDEFFPTSLIPEDECDFEELTKSNTERLLIICDDLYFSKKLNEISEHFLIKGRHRNTSWIVLTQSIFNQPALKNISRNSTHMTLFKNVRLNEPHILFSQLRPRSSKVLQNIYSEATEKPYGYLDIDLSQTCPDKLRYKTNLFDSVVKVFIIMNESSFKTMYLVNKNILDGQKNFKLSIQNKDICTNGMNVMVRPIKQRKSKRLNVDAEHSQLDDQVGYDKEDNQNIPSYGGDPYDADDKPRLENENSQGAPPERINDPLYTTATIAPTYQKSSFDTSIFHEGDRGQVNPQHDLNNFKRNPGLKRENSSEATGKSIKRAKTLNISKTSLPVRKIKRYQLNRYQKRLKKRQFHSSPNLSLSSRKANPALLLDSDAQSPIEPSSESSKTSFNDEKEELVGPTIGNNKRQKMEDRIDDQWISGLKSRLNDRRVQFKRKNDTIGYRVIPEDESKSIIKPTDFKFLDPVTSSELLGKWKPLKELKRKQYKAKRLKPFRSFAVWKEPSS
jgi:hypothetical protein